MRWLKKNLTTLILILAAVVGIGLIAYPTFSDWWNSFHQSRAVASYMDAVTDLDENEYGICIECGQEISPARLEVKPYARFCLECKSRKEMHEGRHR